MVRASPLNAGRSETVRDSLTTSSVRASGEHNGSAYHAVPGPDGQPLGGAADPFTEQLRNSIPPAPFPAPEPAPVRSDAAKGADVRELHNHLRDGQKPRMVAVNRSNLNMKLASGDDGADLKLTETPLPRPCGVHRHGHGRRRTRGVCGGRGRLLRGWCGRVRGEG